MKDFSTARFWAITGVGYGKGFTPEEAVENYRKTQARNFKMKLADVDALSWGRIWEAPEGATGFVLDGEVHWHDDQDNNLDTKGTIVGDVGDVPEWAKRDGEEG